MARRTNPMTTDQLRETLIQTSCRRLLASGEWLDEDIEGMKDPMDAVVHAMSEDCLKKASSDIAKISFDIENLYVGAAREDTEWHAALRDFLGFRQIGGLAFLGCLGGGDWQDPVAFVLYHDGKEVRGYVPTDGNSFVLATKTAAAPCDRTEPRVFDVPLMIAEVVARIDVTA